MTDWIPTTPVHAACPELRRLRGIQRSLKLRVRWQRLPCSRRCLRRRAERCRCCSTSVHLNLAGPELEDRMRRSPGPRCPRARGRLALAGERCRLVARAGPRRLPDISTWHLHGWTRRRRNDVLEHARHIQGRLEVPLALENPTVLAQCAGRCTSWTSWRACTPKTSCPLILDVGHLVSYQWSAQQPLDAGLDGFPDTT